MQYCVENVEALLKIHPNQVWEIETNLYIKKETEIWGFTDNTAVSKAS